MPGHVLTRDDITALRTADSVYLTHGKAGREEGSPPGLIVALAERKRRVPRPFAPTTGYADWVTGEYTVATDSRIHAYIDGGSRTRHYSYAFAMLSALRLHSRWATAVRGLRVGDVLTLDWSVDGFANEYLQRATTPSGGDAVPLHCDSVSLLVTRNGKRVGDYLLTVSICPDNTARMCR